MVDPEPIRERFSRLSPHLDERGRRIFAAVEANACGHGGIAAVSRATGIAVSKIGRGLKDLLAPEPLPPGRVRRAGGGRRPLVSEDPGLLPDLLALVEPDERGHPMSPLRWTCKSLRRLAKELTAMGHKVSRTVVGELLREQKFSLQANRKTREGSDNPDRDAQFLHINKSVAEALADHQPVISVDTKKKELVGDFKNGGREWRPQGSPEEVRVHDFLIKDLGRAVPYGIYDIASNAGWVSVGINHDTAEFAVQTIRRWWHEIGSVRYPDAKRLLITADGGGSNGSRVRLWKRELQRLACELNIDIVVHHLPPGTSKWNKIEHRLFSFITQNWRAKPLVSYKVIVDLISATSTLKVLTRNIDTGTSEGRLFFHITAAFDEFQRELIVENTRAGLAAARKRGRRGGRPRVLDKEKTRVAEAMLKDTVNYPFVGDVIDHLRIGRTAFYRYFPPDRIRELRNQT